VPLGLYPIGMCGADFAALLRKQYDDFGRVIREANIKAEWADRRTGEYSVTSAHALQEGYRTRPPVRPLPQTPAREGSPRAA
jgi:hypothetical protein